MIDITHIDLVKFAQRVYELSRPEGMGFMHYVPGPLSDEDAKKLVRAGEGSVALNMDYVRGRCCKMTVHRSDDGRLTIRGDQWFDHTVRQFAALLETFGLECPAEAVSGYRP